MHVIGEVEGRVAIVVDDMIDTAGTLCAGAEVLLKYGATKIVACATHPVLSGPAIDRINETEALSQVIVTDTIPLPQAEGHFRGRAAGQDHSQHPYRLFGKRVVCITGACRTKNVNTSRKGMARTPYELFPHVSGGGQQGEDHEY